MEDNQTLGTLRGVVRRRWRPFAAVACSVAALACTVAVGLPAVYRSSARILVEAQQIPQEFVKTTVTSYVEERLQTISQQVMSRATLLDVINRFRLYPGKRGRETPEDTVDRLRKAIELKTISADAANKTGRPGTATVAFTVSFEGEDPATVQRVTDALASLYLAENLKSRTQQATGTTSFLQQERDELRAQTEALAAQISAFKRAHVGELPEYDLLNLQALERAQRDLDRLDAQAQMLLERKVYLEGQLATVPPDVAADQGREPTDPRRRLRELKLRLSFLRSRVAEEHPDVRAAKSELRQLEAQLGGVDDSADKAARLEELRAQLAKRRQELGPRHPDLAGLEREVEALGREVQPPRPARTGAADEASNPAYINLRTQVASTELELKGTADERRRAQAKMGEVERKISRAPLAEQDYARLNRDFQTAQRKYDEINNKLLEAQVSQGMEEKQQGERFTIVDPAALPDRPFRPNRLAIVLIGLVLGLGAGVGVAAAKESLDGSFKSADELSLITELPVLCSLPLVEGDEEKGLRGRRWTQGAVAAAVALAGAVAAVHWFVSPLDVVWFRLARRFFN